MVISKTQFCVNLLSEFFKPGGNIIPKSQLVTDANRPLINARINKGFRIGEAGKVEIELIGINTQPGQNLFTQNCFEFNCFTEEGLENSLVDIGTDICLVQGTSNEYMTPNQRAVNNNTCYLDGFGKKRYFIRGTRDIYNYVYVADIGIVNTTSGYFTVLDANVPFFSSNKPGSLFALSVRNIPFGVKAVRIKRVSTFDIEVIGTVYGQLEQEFYFPHSLLKSNRAFTFEGQKIHLEDLSINLLLMSGFKRFETKRDQIIYRNINYSSPELENIVFSSGRILVDLINNDIVPQRGSLPKYITTYLNNEDQYNSAADEDYVNLVKNCFDVQCFEPGCFEEIINNSLITRGIDNRAIAWLLQFLTSYAINYNVDLTTDISKIADYLLRQKDPSNKLYYKGWDPIEEECTELNTEDLQDIQTESGVDICIEGDDPENTSQFYNKSLELNNSIITSTNVAIFLALLKAYEYTQNFNYIVDADELYTAINKYLVNSSNLYKHSLDTPQTSVESGTYQLIINLVTEEYGSINELISFFRSRLYAPPAPKEEVVQVGAVDVLVNIDTVVIPELEVLDSDEDNILFTPTEFDDIESSEDIFKYNYLAFSSFNFLSSKISIPFLQQIEDQYALIEDFVVENRRNTSLIYAIGCLIDNSSFLGFDNLKFNSLLDFNNYRFQKEFMFNNMLLNTPKEYNWFSPSALNRGTHVGAMLYSFSKSLARVNAEYEKVKRSLSIDELYGVLLNRKAEDYNLVRFNKEEDNLLRTRIKNEIFNRSTTKPDIESRLELFNSETSINDNYLAILASESSEDTLYNAEWGIGYLQGPKTYNTNIVTFNFAQPIEPDVYREIQRLKPAGINLDLVEVYTFTVASPIEKGTAVIITDINGGCANLDLETNGDILLETSCRICLEDEETVVTPIVVTPPVLPPLDNPAPIEETCDCISLRGFIAVNAAPTEVRNMRLINGGSSYDVNYTNDTVEPCDLKVGKYIENNTLEYLELTSDPFPNDVASLGSIKSIQAVVDSSETNQVFTIATIDSGGTSSYIWREGNLGFASAQLAAGQNLSVLSTINFIFIYDKDAETFYTVNKANMNVTTVSFSPNVNATNHEIISIDNTTIGIYSTGSSDNIIYTYTWTQGAGSITAGDSITLTAPYIAYYFKDTSGLKRYTELIGTSTEIYNTPGFDELGTVDITLSSTLNADYVIHHEGKNYFVSRVDALPQINAIVYQNTGSIVRSHSTISALSELVNPFYNVTSGQLIPLGNYYLVAGSNQAYSFSSNNVSSINSLRCASDATQIPSGYVVQTVSSSTDGAIVTVVNLLSESWDRYRIKPVNKTC